MASVRSVQLVALEEISARQWSELVAGEREPWGGVAEGLTWAPKERHLALSVAGGRLIAIAGLVRAEVVLAAAGRFPVVGVGSVFVTSRRRGRGLVRELLEPLLETAAEMGPEHAMLFCRPQLTALYAKLAFVEIQEPVSVQQPDGPVEMPLRSMWRALREGASWPAGRVELQGLPF